MKSVKKEFNFRTKQQTGIENHVKVRLESRLEYLESNGKYSRKTRNNETDNYALSLRNEMLRSRSLEPGHFRTPQSALSGAPSGIMRRDMGPVRLHEQIRGPAV